MRSSKEAMVAVNEKKRCDRSSHCHIRFEYLNTR